MTTERRYQNRQSYPLKAWCRTDRCFHSVELENFSSEGARLHLPGPIRPGRRIVLAVESRGRVSVLNAVVVWAQPAWQGHTQVGVKLRAPRLKAG